MWACSMDLWCHYLWSSLCLSDALSCGACNNHYVVPITIHPGSKFVPRRCWVLRVFWSSLQLYLLIPYIWLMISSHYVIFLFAEWNLNRLQVNALRRRGWTVSYRMPSSLCSLQVPTSTESSSISLLNLILFNNAVSAACCLYSIDWVGKMVRFWV
jgi:hypothetical protein